MNASGPLRSLRQALLLILGAVAFEAGAEVFYSGDTKGLPGEPVHLSINARATTTLEAIDIAPFFTEVAGVLNSGTLAVTDALKTDGIGPCDNQVCGLFFLSPKSFAADTLLATVSFTIAPTAPPGMVEFDPGVVVDVTPLPIPASQQFQVLAVPEPSSWLTMLVGLGLVALAAPRCRSARSSFRARRAVVRRARRGFSVAA